MTRALDGARLKIIRAEEHLKSFNEEGWRYVCTEPYDVVTKSDGDVIEVEGIITVQPPDRLACIVGDFVTNLRASLDYVAWELAMSACARSGISLTDSQLRRITFPIAADHGSFSKADGTANYLQCSCGVPASAIAIIESVQPYHAGNECLLTLDKLVRMDKHRALLLCGGWVADTGRISIYRNGTRQWYSEGGIRLMVNLAARPEPRGSASDYTVEVEGKPTIFISIKDFPSPGDSMSTVILEQIFKCVANIIPRFDVVV